MEFLSWLSAIAGILFLVIFIYWAIDVDRVRMQTLKNAFIGGVILFSALFLILSIHSLMLVPARSGEEKLTPQVVNGKKVWHKYVCIDCHTLLGNGAYYGPDLTKTWDRFLKRAEGDEGIARASLFTFLKNPPPSIGYRRGMPNFHLSDQEINDLIEFFRWIDQIDTNNWPPPPSKPLIAEVAVKEKVEKKAAAEQKEGERIFKAKGCVACHTVGKGRLVGPDLKGVSKKYSRDFMEKWLKNPDIIYAEGKRKPLNEGFPPMPPQNLTHEEIEHLIHYLETL